MLKDGLAFLDTKILERSDIFDALTPKPITLIELQTANIAPRTIVPNFLYADVRTRIAAGGVGKTTLALHEAARLALGLSVYGFEPAKPVKTVLVSREDPRHILVARLREICIAQSFTSSQIEQVLNNVHILDLSNQDFRLTRIIGDSVRPDYKSVLALCEALRPLSPDWVQFDPMVSFGTGESRVNDAEQGLIEACRVIRNQLDCCIELIHHTGKANAREKTSDQYSGRGGSALADGCRMVCVIQPADQSEWLAQTGKPLQPHETGLVMALPKMSYCKPSEPILIRRNGFLFTHETGNQKFDVPAHNAQILHDFISVAYFEGKRYSGQQLENLKDEIGLSRDKLRAALTNLETNKRLVYVAVRGKLGSHYEPLSVADTNGEYIKETALIDESCPF